jgi:hypothetical protein
MGVTGPEPPAIAQLEGAFRAGNSTLTGAHRGAQSGPEQRNPALQAGLLAYRYRDSNPGFRTENCLFEAIWGRSVLSQSKEFDSVQSGSVDLGTYFGTRINGGEDRYERCQGAGCLSHGPMGGCVVSRSRRRSGRYSIR